MVFKLVNEAKTFNVSTTGIDVKYSDTAEASLRLCANFTNETTKSLIQINFLNVAELKCKTINFYESYYKEYEITTSSEDSSKNTSGFYSVLESAYLDRAKGIYDPRNNLNLKHYLIAGGDGFCEVIASSFSVVVLSNNA